MKITDIHSEKRGFSLISVRFGTEEPENRRENRRVQKMNRFYEALEQAAEQYADVCTGVCALSRYICEIRAVQEADGIRVTVRLTHRLPGEASRRKNCLHLWRDGFLLEEKKF